MPQKITQKIVPNTACRGGIAHLYIWNVNYARYRNITGLVFETIAMFFCNWKISRIPTTGNVKIYSVPSAVVELTLPYHGSRNRPGATISDYFLSPNIGRTIRSVRQSVIDTRGVVDWLCQRGYINIGLIGASLGSSVAGLVAEHDSRICASVLLLTAGDFGEVVWTGRATRHIKESLSKSIGMNELRDLWSIISTATFARALSRADHRTMIISGSRDQVVKPYLTRRFISELQESAAACEWRELACGHYSLALFPFNVVTFFLMLRFLKRRLLR